MRFLWFDILFLRGHLSHVHFFALLGRYVEVGVIWSKSRIASSLMLLSSESEAEIRAGYRQFRLTPTSGIPPLVTCDCEPYHPST
jgi:hypothetical protein